MFGTDGLYVRLNGLADFQIPSMKEDDSVRHLGYKIQVAVGFKVPADNQ
jgi:hypothetical protein